MQKLLECEICLKFFRPRQIKYYSRKISLSQNDHVKFYIYICSEECKNVWNTKKNN